MNSTSDTSLFILCCIAVTIYLLVYVDDIIITGNNSSVVQNFMSLLFARFSLKDLGPLTYFLGVEVLSHPLDLILSHQRYIADLLARAAMTDTRPISTPLSTSPTLSLQSGISLSDPSAFRNIVYSLQYLTLTRPDVAYAVNKLSQYMHRPTVKRILRYLCDTIDHEILLHRRSPHFNYMPTRTSTQPAIRMILPLPAPSFSTSVAIQSLGVPRNNAQLLNPPLSLLEFQETMHSCSILH